MLAGMRARLKSTPSPEVAVALEPRRVPVLAAPTAARLELIRQYLEEAGRRIGLRGCGGRAGGFPGAGAGTGLRGLPWSVDGEPPVDPRVRRHPPRDGA
jgi:hypothetical protein